MIAGNLDMSSQKAVFKFEGNEWVTPIADQLQVGIGHLMDYLRTETYRMWVECVCVDLGLTVIPIVLPQFVQPAREQQAAAPAQLYWQEQESLSNSLTYLFIIANINCPY